MAQTIKLKNSGTSSNTPSSLEHGELAINYADGKIFYKNSSNSIVEFANLSGSFLPLSGGTLTGNLSLGDNVKAQFGAGNDLEIYHNGSHSFISEQGTGDLYIGASNNIALMNAAFSENKLLATTDGALKLYYNGSEKLATTSTGIDVTGTADVSSEVLVGTNNSRFAENNLRFLSAGTAFFDHATTNQSMDFRLSASSSLDTTALTISPTLITSNLPLKITGSSGADRYIQLDLDGRGSAFTGQPHAFIFNGQGSTGDFLAGALYFQSRSASVNREIGFITGTTPTKKMTISGTGNVNIPNGSLMVGATTAPSSYYAFANNLVVTGDSANRAGMTISGTATSMINLSDGTGLVGFIDYNHSNDSMTLGTAASNALVIDSSQNATFSGSTSVTGSASANTSAITMGFTAPDGEIKVKNTTGAPASNLDFYTTNSSGTTAIAMRLTHEKDVSISRNLTMNGTLIGASSISCGTISGGAATFTTTDNTDTVSLISTDADANIGPVLRLYRNSASPADNDSLGQIIFKGKDDAGNEATFGRIETIATDVSNGSENAKMEFYVAVNDTFNPSLTLEDSGAASFSGSVTTGSSLVSTNAIVDSVIAKTSSGNVIVKTNAGGNIARFNNNLSTDFFGSVTSTGQINAGTNLVAGTSVYSGNGVYYGSTTLALKNNTSGNFLSFAANANATFSGSVSATSGNYTTSETASLADGTNGLRIVREGGDGAGSLGNGITFAQRWWSNSTQNVRTGAIFGKKINGSGGYGGGLAFYSQPASAADMVEALSINHLQQVNIPNGSLMVGSTTAPSSRFHLKSASRGSVALRVTDSDTTNDILRSGSQPDGDGFLQLRTVGGAGNVLFDASGDSYVNGGNFGISTSSPSEKLHINRASGTGAYVRIQDAAGSNYIGTDGGVFQILDGSASELMRINPSGAVGIGTSSPDAIIETSASATGNTVGALLTNTNGSGTADSVSLNFGLGRSADGYIRSVEAIKLLKEQQWTGTVSTVDAALVFSTVSNEATLERMRIDSSGNVGIGITNPTEKFTVVNASSGIVGRFTNNIDQTLDLGVIAGSGANGGVYYSSANSGYHSFQVGTSEKMRLDSSGNFTVGGTSAQAKAGVQVSTSTAIPTGALAEANDGHFSIWNTNASAAYSGLSLRTRTSSSTTALISLDYNSSFNDGELAFRVRDGAGTADKMLSLKANTGATFSGSVTSTGLTSQLNGNGGLPVSSGTSQTYGSLRVGATSFATILDMGTAGATGAWLQASDKTALGTNYSLLLNPNGGSVGVGLDNPSFRLHVLDTIGTRTLSLGHGVSSGTITTDTAKDLNFQQAGSTKVTLTASGTLLIGKTADNDSDVGIRMQSTGHTSITKSGGNCLTLNRLSSDGSLLDFRKDTGTVVGSIESATNTTTDLAIGSGNVRLLFFTNGSAIVPRAENNNSANGTIDLGNSGNRFKDAHFSGTVNAATGAFTGTSAASVFTRTGSAGQVLHFKFGASSTGNITVQTAGLGLGGGTRENDLFINTSGQVIIGSTTPSKTLKVEFSDTNTSTTNGGTKGLEIKNTATATNTYAPIHFHANQSFGRIALKNVDGNEEISQFEFIVADDGSAINAMTIGSTGNVTITGSCTATSFPTSSDARLKDNIEDAKDSGEIIDKIKVRQFDWKKTGKHQDYGMIAQELILEVPDAVSTPTEDHEMMGIDYSKLVPMLVKEIQQLRARVQTLEEEK